MTGEELSVELRCSPATVSRLLSNDRDPSVSLMLRIRDRIGWSLDYQVELMESGRFGEKLRTWMVGNVPTPKT